MYPDTPCAVTADLNRYLRDLDRAEAYEDECDEIHNNELKDRTSQYGWRWRVAEAKARQIQALEAEGKPVPAWLRCGERELREWCARFIDAEIERRADAAAERDY